MSFYQIKITDLTEEDISEISHIVVEVLSLHDQMKKILVAFIELHTKLINEGSSIFTNQSNGIDVLFYLLMAGEVLQHELFSTNMNDKVADELVVYVRTNDEF